jgi:hypothetical protein
MIVIGVDVHKHSVTAVAIDEAARMLDEKTVAVGPARPLLVHPDLADIRTFEPERLAASPQP